MEILFEENYGIECKTMGLPNRLNVTIYYSKGGYDGWQHERRGYWLSISPLCGNTYGAYTGVKVCLAEVKRKSKSKTAEVLNNYSDYFNRLVAKFAEKNGYKLTGREQQ